MKLCRTVAPKASPSNDKLLNPLIDDEPIIRVQAHADRCQASAHAGAIEALAVFEVEHRGVVRTHQHSTLENMKQLRFVVQRQREVGAAVVVSEDALAQAEQHDPERILTFAENDFLTLPFEHITVGTEACARSWREGQCAPIIQRSALFGGENKMNRHRYITDWTALVERSLQDGKLGLLVEQLTSEVMAKVKAQIGLLKIDSLTRLPDGSATAKGVELDGPEDKALLDSILGGPEPPAG